MANRVERRRYPRIHVATEIRVTWSPVGQAEGVTFRSSLLDLSLGGIRFEASQPMGTVGETVDVTLPAVTGAELKLPAEILRISKERNRYVLAARFMPLTDDVGKELAEIITVLLDGAGGGTRRHPRIAYRMEVRCGGGEETQALLEDISEGGVQLTLDRQLTLGEVVELHVPAGDASLTLLGRVVHQHLIRDSGTEDSYRAGLEFDAHDADTDARLRELMRTALAAKST